MTKLLRLFLHSPVAPPGLTWERVHGYGPAEAVPGPGMVIRDHLRLRATQDGQLRAAVAGKLSILPPLAGGVDATSAFDPPQSGRSLPERVTLYLHASPTVFHQEAFRARAAAIGGIVGFAYLGIETASLEVALRELLDRAVIPADVLRARAVEMLLSGLLDVFVPAGQHIGSVGKNVEVGFACITGRGTIDPSYAYDLMRDFVEEGQSSVNEFLDLAPKSWPVIDPLLDEAAALNLTQKAVYPFSALEELRDRLGLSAAKWRQIGDHQKQLYRKRLLARVGHAPAGNTEPPFEFSDMDWQNVFQLEAIVEFYSLFPDPSAPNEVPGTPGPGTGIDFLDPAGEKATAVGKVVTLDGTADLSRVQNGNLIHLDADTARTDKWYRIQSIDAVSRRVTLEASDGEPRLSAATFAWRIRLHPVLVCIDSFGGRIQGTRARRTGANTLTLDAPELRKVNVHFDTLYLPDDEARPSRTYRIVAFDNAAHTVTLDGDPRLGDGTARWHVPAGLSGELPALRYSLGPGNPPDTPDPRLHDHYDGAMFVIHDGKVHGKVRVSTYTSRDYPPGSESLSSIRGNRRYDVVSFRSEKKTFLNYCFKVTDPGRPRDEVQEARFYFSQRVTRDQGGKTSIRIHRGNINGPRGTGSEGCIVSPLFHALRDILIERWEADARALNAPVDASVHQLLGAGNEKAEELWRNNKVKWNDKLSATLWVIRPDERALQ